MALKVGIISANWGAFAHLPAWRSLDGVEVTAICTSRRETAEAAAARYGIDHACWDAAQLAAAPDIDVLDCGTRPSIREAMVLAGLENGKHVYAGIPFAADLAGARRLYRAWRKAGTVGVVDALSEWIPAHRAMKQHIDAGAIGQPFGGTCVFNMSLFNRLDPQFPYNWFAQGGHGVSAVRNLGSHALHLLIGLFGPVRELVAHDARLLDRWSTPDDSVSIAVETNDFATVMLRFASGLVIQLQVSWNAPLGPGWSLDVFGSDGRIVAQSPSFPTARDTTLQMGRLGAAALEPVAIPDTLMHEPGIGIDADFPIPPSYPMALAMHAMVAGIAGGAAARPDFEQAWQVERVLEAIRLSAKGRRWIELDEIE